MNGPTFENMVYELNERAAQYRRHGLSIEVARQQAVEDFKHHLLGVGYKILSDEEVKRHSELKFFESM